MKEKLKKFIRFVQAYQFYGIYLFIKIHWLKGSSVRLRKYGRIYIRKNTCDAEVFDQVFISKQYNFDIKENVKVIVDLGGNNGMSALFFHKKYPDATIYVLEPDQDNFRMLQKQIAGINNIIPLNKAIWKENGTVSLNSSESWAIQVDMQSGKNMVESITMDTLMTSWQIPYIDLLKIDIEGAEKELFESDTSFLSKINVMVIELHDWMKEGCAQTFFQALTSYNYSYAGIHENVLITNLQLKKGTLTA